MNNIDHYIETAKDNAGFKSDRELSFALGFKNNSVTFWRTKRALPRDDVMEKLAEFAGMDRETAILELNYWRAPETVKKTYENILKTLGKAMLIIAVSPLLLYAKPAQASTQDNAPIVYLMGNDECFLILE